MKSFKIGSGDTTALLSGKNTKGFQNLLRQFVSDEVPYYNAYASPIDALRTGKILEDRYYDVLPDGYFPQVKCRSTKFNVSISSLDYAYIEAGNVVDFDELKTVFFTDFIDLNLFKNEEYKVYREMILKRFKTCYNQVQKQLFDSELDSANLVFLEVHCYDDEVNYIREINDNEVIKFRIYRDDEVINKIKDRLKFFQDIKDYFAE